MTPVMTVTPERVIATARGYLGTPFHHQGRAPGVGLDCAGVVVCVAHALGLSAADVRGYSRQPDPVLFRALLREHLIELPGEGAAGDVLTFWLGREQHLAIVTALTPLRILHAWQPAGAVVEHDCNPLWVRRARGWFRFPGVA